LTVTHEANQLAKLKTPEAYQADRANIFPSKTSLQWYMRTRREQLVKARALLVPAGRMMIDPEAFDQVVLAASAQPWQAAA
jgi:uncharacterized membrane protein YgaE (UPF0421/DUF939 family)